MKIYYREQSLDYSNYSFGYSIWAEWEEGDSLDDFLSKGFLPYSANPQQSPTLFYLARSLRVPLDEFKWTKKRRYEGNLFSRANASIQEIPISDEINRSPYWKDAQRWMKDRFDVPYLTEERFTYIWNQPFCRLVLEFKDASEKRIAFALINPTPNSAHYWYCFYDSQHPELPNLGSLCLFHFIEWAKSTSRQFAYLGTSYGNKSAYKSKGLSPIHFFDGQRWNDDRTLLKTLQSKDPD